MWRGSKDTYSKHLKSVTFSRVINESSSILMWRKHSLLLINKSNNLNKSKSSSMISTNKILFIILTSSLNLMNWNNKHGIYYYNILQNSVYINTLSKTYK